jgi:flagellar biosynthetic protein FliR
VTALNDPTVSTFTAWLLANAGTSALAFARAVGLVWTAPAFSTPGLGARPRAVLAGLLAVLLAPAVAAAAREEGRHSLPVHAAALVAELTIGSALGMSAALVVAGARQAGEIVGAQAGLSAAALFDPEAGEELSALSQLYGLIALGVFLALDGPLILVRALSESYRVIPPGGPELLTLKTASLVFGRVGEALALAVRAAAPVGLALALAGVALGLLGRAAPSLQPLALAIPVRVGVGLFLVLLGLASLAATMNAAWSGWPGGLLP